MSDALYEQYKEALRRGHVAALRGRDDAALEAYGEAARIAPDRALPLVGLAAALGQLGKHAEALNTYDAALERAPTDEGALRGRAALLESMGRPSDAAASLDRLVVVLDGAGRVADAADVARHALELAELRDRRRAAASLAERLRAEPSDPAGVAALGRLSDVLDPTALTPPLIAVPFDPIRATAEVEAAVESGDLELARATALDAAAGHRLARQLDAAIDACYLALAPNPADPALHLMLTDLYLDRGWRATATEKLLLLARLAELTDDSVTRTRLCAIATERLADEPRLMALCT